MSNEIIARSCAAISLDDVFNGDVHASVRILNESVECGVQWKGAYQRTKAAVWPVESPQNTLQHIEYDAFHSVL